MATQASDFFEPLPPAMPADELAAIVQRAQALTSAFGAATAIREANSNQFVCRASSGSLAPEVGIALPLEGTFTGMCIQSGEELICDDAEVDARVDTAAIRALGVRSIAVTPVKDDGRVIGVLAVFSSKPHAFTIPLVGVLQALADQITSQLRKESRGKEEKRFEPALILAKPSASPTPPPPVELVTAGSTTPTDNRDAAESASSSSPGVSKTQSIWTAPGFSDNEPAMLALLEEIVKLEPKVTATPPDHHRLEPRSQSAVTLKLIHDTRRAITIKRVKGLPDKFFLIGATIALLALAGTTIGLLRMSNRGTATPIQSSQPQGSSALAASSTPIVSGPAREPLSGAKLESVQSSVAANRPNEKEQKTNRAGSSAPARRGSVTLSDSKISLASVSSQNEVQDIDPAPDLGSSSVSDLTLLARPVSNAPPAKVVQSDFVGVTIIQAVPATYPAAARERGVFGAVTLLVKVGRDGRITNLKFISGPSLLRDAALDAVKQWRFKPAMLDGQPIEQETQITVNFKP